MEGIGRRITVQAGIGKNLRPYLKKLPKAKQAGGVDQVVGYLHSKREALSSNPSIAKTKNKKM
jgi:hypothetical protein